MKKTGATEATELFDVVAVNIQTSKVHQAEIGREWKTINQRQVTVGDFRNAARALEETK